MISSRRINRLIRFTCKPFLFAIFVTLLIRLFTSPKKTPPKPPNPHPHLEKHLIIASTQSSNLTWLPAALQISYWTPKIYITDTITSSRDYYTVPKNKGNEAMVYLTYIIENYSSLPDVMFFHHDHEQSWHQSFSSAYELVHLNPLSVQKQGYLSPRCLSGCENIIILPSPKDTALPSPYALTSSSPRDIQLASVLREFFYDEAKGEWRGQGRVPEKIAAPCCAQFAVSREQVHRRSENNWREIRAWLEGTELGSRASGRVLEWTWHLWFGMEDEFCPEETQCLCDVFGLGDCS